jgi:hypothetical protein
MYSPSSHLHSCTLASIPILQPLQQLLLKRPAALPPPARPVLLHSLLQAAYQLLLPLHLLL